jgi:hypothetical protein
MLLIKFPWLISLRFVGGMTVGTWVHMLLLGAVVVGTTNWEAEAKKANERVGGVTH